MEAPRRRAWLVSSLLLLIALVIGSLLLYTRIPRSLSWEIELTTPTPYPLQQVYIGGAVISPGLYPVSPQQSLEELIRAAGGLGAEAEAERWELRVPARGEAMQPQRVNINTAQPWLLKALPGIGDVLAQAIVEDRQRRGPFRNAEEIMRVRGIGPKIFDGIKDLITVGE